MIPNKGGTLQEAYCTSPSNTEVKQSAECWQCTMGAQYFMASNL